MRGFYNIARENYAAIFILSSFADGAVICQTRFGQTFCFGPSTAWWAALVLLIACERLFPISERAQNKVSIYSRTAWAILVRLNPAASRRAATEFWTGNDEGSWFSDIKILILLLYHNFDVMQEKFISLRNELPSLFPS